jgi:hypothetical protein
MTRSYVPKVRCVAIARRSGFQCTRPAIAGATVCRAHGGAAPQVRAHALVRAELSKWTLGEAVDDPGEVLLRLVTQSRMRVDAYSAELEKLVAESPTLRDALVGDAMGEFGKVGEYIRGLAQLESLERDRLATFASKAVQAGLGERQVRLAERQGEMLAAVLSRILDNSSLGLTAYQKELMPGVMRETLSTMAGESGR